MTEFDYPTPGNLPALLALWRLSFDVDEFFLQDFFDFAYHPSRCRIAKDGYKVLSMLYWFDCQWQGRKVAYLYAVATAKAHRGKGLASALLEDTHRELERLGYDGCILVPANEALFSFYQGKGYETRGFLREETVSAGPPVALRQVEAGEYGRLRRELLPENGLIQEGASLSFLSTMAKLYAGADFIAAVSLDPQPSVLEMLGDPQAVPGILGTLGVREAQVRSPGTEKPFAMTRWFRGAPPESLYLSFAFE